MTHTIRIKSYAAIPAILALAGAAFVLKPEEMRRDPLIEAQGMIGLAAKYEVMYAECATANTALPLPSAGPEGSVAGSYSQQFPARSDEDALHFALRARPQCEMASLYRLERVATGGEHAQRYAGRRIDI